MHTRTSEILGYIKEAKRAIALGVWRESFALQYKAMREPNPVTARAIRTRESQMFRRAKRLYEAADKTEIPEFSEN